MKNRALFIFFLASNFVTAQSIEWKREMLEPIGVSMSIEKLNGKNVVKVVKDSSIKADDEPTFVRIKGADFHDGIIEVNVLSKLTANDGSFLDLNQQYGLS